MKNRPSVLILESMYHPAGEALLASNTDIPILQDASNEAIIAAIADASAVFVRYPRRLSASAIHAGAGLVVISTSGRGTDAIDIAAATECGIAVVNNPGLGSVPVSEHTLGLMLDFAKQISRSNVEIRRGTGFGKGHLSTRFHLEGRTIGIIGCGQIGAEVVRKCTTAFRMRALVYDPYVSASAVADVGGARVEALETLLTEADFVSVHAELTEETRGMIDETVLRQMRPTAFFLNTARGPIVQQAALVRALKEDWIAGAALDVFESEPLPSDSPLHGLENLIMTPHVAGLTLEAREELSLSAANQILQVLGGERPPYLVNPEVWGQVAQRLQTA
ncbi:MAG: NAD(P)-dependent oxidoreductase [Proteobacteria bacterium]|nr:NAD(P)-dependent oxidoreductase [Pseudomonadota bacterium]